jgi:hypothetical protein
MYMYIQVILKVIWRCEECESTGEEHEQAVGGIRELGG